MNPGFAAFKNRISNPFAFRLFLLSKLPLVYFTGIRIEHLAADSCITSVRYSWLNQNPFRSIYFAVLQMAAELSTGVLCMGNTYRQQPPISMLVVKTEAVYHKKAVGKILFTCNDGAEIAAIVQQAKTSGEGLSLKCYSVATDENKDIVGEFWITWSFKMKSTLA